MKLVDDLDFGQFQALNVTIQNLASSPSAPDAGQMWYLTGSGGLWYWDSTLNQVRPLDPRFLTDGSIQIAALATNPLLRSNQQGTQPASTISNLEATVTAYTLDQFEPPVAPLNLGGQRATNGAPATLAVDLPTWSQVQGAIQAAIQGQTALKNPARLYASGNVNISGPTSNVFDGVSANSGDRVACFNQTAGTQSNVYVFNGTGAQMTVPADCVNWIEGTEILITEGTQFGGAVFRQVTQGSPVFGTTALTWSQTFKVNTYLPDGVTIAFTGFTVSVQFDTDTLTTEGGDLAVRTDVFARKYSTNIVCDGQNKNFNVVHNLGTTDVMVGLRDSDGNVAIPDSNPANTTTVVVSFGSVMPQGTTYRVTVLG